MRQGPNHETESPTDHSARRRVTRQSLWWTARRHDEPRDGVHDGPFSEATSHETESPTDHLTRRQATRWTTQRGNGPRDGIHDGPLGEKNESRVGVSDGPLDEATSLETRESHTNHSARRRASRWSPRRITWEATSHGTESLMDHSIRRRATRRSPRRTTWRGHETRVGVSDGPLDEATSHEMKSEEHPRQDGKTHET